MPRKQERYCAGLARNALQCAGYLENHRFDFLGGNPTPRRPNGTALPVDAYYPDANLVLEFREGQHYGDRFAFRDSRITATGETRKQQRQKYDKKREDILPANGIRLLIVYDYQLSGGYDKDIRFIKEAIKELMGNNSLIYNRPTK